MQDKPIVVHLNIYFNAQAHTHTFMLFFCCGGKKEHRKDLAYDYTDERWNTTLGSHQKHELLPVKAI